MRPRRSTAIALLATILAVSGCSPSPTPTAVASVVPSSSAAVAIASPSSNVAAPSASSNPTSLPLPSAAQSPFSSAFRLGYDWSIDQTGIPWPADVVIEPDRLVHFGDPQTDKPVIWTSTDGLTWQQGPRVRPSSFLANWSLIRRWKSRDLALMSACVGDAQISATAWESTNGTNWRQIGVLPGIGPGFVCAHDVQAMPDRLVVAGSMLWCTACGEGGSVRWRPAVWTSEDGRRWRVHPLAAATRSPTGSQSSLVRLRDGLYLFAYATGSKAPVLWRSSTGLAWTRVPADLKGYLPVQIVDGGSAYVALGVATGNTESTALMISSDGRHWRTVLHWAGSGTRLVQTGSLIVLDGGPPDPGLTRDVIWVSSDAVHWTRAASLESDGQLVWYGGHLILLTDGVSYVSPPVPDEQLVPSQ